MRHTHGSTIRSVLTRGFTSRCPRCGEGPVFDRWNTLSVQCTVCGVGLKQRDGDCWFFMYMTTGFFTGVMIAAMFFIRPANVLFGQVAVGSIGLALIVATLPIRKSLAIALDFYLEAEKSGWLLYEERREA
ncbi:MAG: DUF983 domain-containing protein [Bacteroidota bacterium]